VSPTQFEAATLARDIRADALRMVAAANASHIGTCLSMGDILAVLYADILRYDVGDPSWSDRDRFILSKGHGAAILYAVLAEVGFFETELLAQYCCDGSMLMGHASHKVPGVEVSTGSLGHGLPIGTGMALAAKRGGVDYRTFVLVGDGELDEGSNWEAMLFATTHELDGLVMIVDRNGLQGFGESEDVMRLEPLAAKLEAFGWDVMTVDGHDCNQLRTALARDATVAGKPRAIIADTIKGKGVSYMEGKIEWHYRSPNAEQLAQALAELGVDS
jgi:transketolase